MFRTITFREGHLQFADSTPLLGSLSPETYRIIAAYGAFVVYDAS